MMETEQFSLLMFLGDIHWCHQHQCPSLGIDNQGETGQWAVCEKINTGSNNGMTCVRCSVTVGSCCCKSELKRGNETRYLLK